MCHESALVERPNCSSTSTHSSFDQPCPPCSRACRPPWSSAAIASDLMRATSSSVISRRSAFSSSGNSTSSTKRRARAWSSVCSGSSR